jgi:hypothetical protein
MSLDFAPMAEVVEEEESMWIIRRVRVGVIE